MRSTQPDTFDVDLSAQSTDESTNLEFSNVPAHLMNRVQAYLRDTLQKRSPFMSTYFALPTGWLDATGWPFQAGQPIGGVSGLDSEPPEGSVIINRNGAVWIRVGEFWYAPRASEPITWAVLASATWTLAYLPAPWVNDDAVPEIHEGSARGSKSAQIP